MRVGILSDYPSPAVQSGPALHTRLLYRGLKSRGHEVVLMGPDTGADAPIESADFQLYRAFSYPTHPKVKVAMPLPLRTLFDAPRVDVIHGQTNNHMIHYGLWMRQMHKVPVINTHTIHLPTHSHFLLSDKLYEKGFVRGWVQDNALGVERNFAKLYNMGDALIVQSRFLVDYWRERGVTIPIEVVGRPIDAGVFSTQPTGDPFPRHFRVGKRLIVVCRHDREKSLDHLIRIFAEEIASNDPDVTLTLVGDGHDHANLVRQAAATPCANRIHFPGEANHGELVDWYAHADLFVYTSVSETFGNVVNEALWCGLPVVALDDRMGVAHQVAHDVNGFLIRPRCADTDTEFAAAVLRLCHNQRRRREMAAEAASFSRRTSHLDVVLKRFERIYGDAQAHCRATVKTPLSEQSKFAQLRSFADNMGQWAWWNGLLLTVAHTATRLGAARKGGANQHEAVMSQVAEAAAVATQPTRQSPQPAAAAARVAL